MLAVSSSLYDSFSGLQLIGVHQYNFGYTSFHFVTNEATSLGSPACGFPNQNILLWYAGSIPFLLNYRLLLA